LIYVQTRLHDKQYPYFELIVNTPQHIHYSNTDAILPSSILRRREQQQPLDFYTAGPDLQENARWRPLQRKESNLF